MTASATRDQVTAAAERDWLERWTAGPTEPEGRGLPIGAPAPDLQLLDDTGWLRHLSEFWATGPALLMFWRHFGCSCGVARADRLKAEWADHLDAGLTPVIIGQGDPLRAAEYRARHDLPCPVLSDPNRKAYRAYGVGQWPVERILYDAPASFWTHAHDEGASFQEARREQGRPLVDDPWRAMAEFVVRPGGIVQLPYLYQYCEDYPDPRVLTTAARLSGRTRDPASAR
jgi:peroxiredoxin